MNDFYIVVRGNQTPSGVSLYPSSTPFKHTTNGAAKGEAERLARDCPGEMFFVMHAIGFARTQKPGCWFDLSDIPF